MTVALSAITIALTAILAFESVQKGRMFIGAGALLLQLPVACRSAEHARAILGVNKRAMESTVWPLADNVLSVGQQIQAVSCSFCLQMFMSYRVFHDSVPSVPYPGNGTLNHDGSKVHGAL